MLALTKVAAAQQRRIEDLEGRLTNATKAAAAKPPKKG